jgi:hypothetical protein
MASNRSRSLCNLGIACLAGTIATVASAAPSIPWYTVDCGGGISSAPITGGTISIRGTAGQADAGACTNTGVGVRGGFWPSGAIASACRADLDDGSGTGTPDNAVTIDDLIYFLIAFENGDNRADLDNGSGTGTLDGAVTIDDLLFLVVHFENGC